MRIDDWLLWFISEVVCSDQGGNKRLISLTNVSKQKIEEVVEKTKEKRSEIE